MPLAVCCRLPLAVPDGPVAPHLKEDRAYPVVFSLVSTALALALFDLATVSYE